MGRLEDGAEDTTLQGVPSDRANSQKIMAKGLAKTATGYGGNDPQGAAKLTDLVYYIEQVSLGPEPTPQPSASLFSICQTDTRVSMQRDAKL